MEARKNGTYVAELDEAWNYVGQNVRGKRLHDLSKHGEVLDEAEAMRQSDHRIDEYLCSLFSLGTAHIFTEAKLHDDVHLGVSSAGHTHQMAGCWMAYSKVRLKSLQANRLPGVIRVPNLLKCTLDDLKSQRREIFDGAGREHGIDNAATDFVSCRIHDEREGVEFTGESEHGRLLEELCSSRVHP